MSLTAFFKRLTHWHVEKRWAKPDVSFIVQECDDGPILFLFSDRKIEREEADGIAAWAIAEGFIASPCMNVRLCYDFK